MHLFDRVLKPGADCTHIWSMIDASKLQDGINGFIEAMKKEKEKKYIEGFKAAGIYDATAEIQVNDGRTIDDFPAFKFYGVPLLTTSIHSILRDIVSLSERTASKILNFPLFNRSDVTCSLVNIPGSISYDRFKRNAKRKSWVDKLLVAASTSREKEESARWMLMHLGEHYNDIFADVACKHGLVLSGKVMDAESACAMWEEANVALRPQRIILWHLASFFGRRITVPEREIRELEQGTLSPIVDMAVINGEDINFWYKNVDEVISHRILIELKGRGRDFFREKGYDSLDTVVGGDDGARKFRAEIRLIFRNSTNKNVEPYSVKLCLGSIDCKKDSREVLEKTFGAKLNDGLKWIFNKVIVIHSTIINNAYDHHVGTFA